MYRTDFDEENKILEKVNKETIELSKEIYKKILK